VSYLASDLLNLLGGQINVNGLASLGLKKIASAIGGGDTQSSSFADRSREGWAGGRKALFRYPSDSPLLDNSDTTPFIREEGFKLEPFWPATRSDGRIKPEISLIDSWPSGSPSSIGLLRAVSRGANGSYHDYRRENGVSNNSPSRPNLPTVGLLLSLCGLITGGLKMAFEGSNRCSS
jgi:hypothetical protein